MHVAYDKRGGERGISRPASSSAAATPAPGPGAGSDTSAFARGSPTGAPRGRAQESRQRGLEAVLFVGEDPESAELLRRLAPGARAVRVVSARGLLGWLYLEYDTARTPVLVAESRVVAGLQEILDFLARAEWG